MSVRKEMAFTEGVFFITFTCYNWIKLFDILNCYTKVYNQFDKLKEEGHYIIGYVIMPNHVHFIVALRNCGKTLNARIGSLKRFLAYAIVEELKQQNEKELLFVLTNGVTKTDKKRGKLHQVFQPSFDVKHCYNEEMILQKLNYMHLNPTLGKFPLVDNPCEYLHSSAKYYICNEEGLYEILNYELLNDIDLTK
jgi:REP element-mobilizing transposase RayT